MQSQLRTSEQKPRIYWVLVARLKPCPPTTLPGGLGKELHVTELRSASPTSYFEFASQIVLDIHRGCTADYAAGQEPYQVWFTRFQEKPALALPHLNGYNSCPGRFQGSGSL